MVWKGERRTMKIKDILKIKEGKEDEWIKNNLAEFESINSYPSTTFAQYNWWTEFIKKIIWSVQYENKWDLIKLINTDIEYQKTKLTGDFEKDKPIKWRIVGFKDLKKKLLEEKANTKS